MASRRRLVLLPPLALIAAGCGGGKVVSPLPETVIGSLPKATPTSAGKAVFSAQGCGSCHTYGPAATSGQIGPDLDKLPQYAKQARQPLVKFVRTSITSPNAYIQSGFPKGVMPSTYGRLPPDQLTALVAFLTSGRRR